MSGEEKAKKWEEEIEDFNHWLGVVKTDDRSLNEGILLFNINNSLKRIADSLAGVAEHFDFVDNKKITR